MLHLYSEKRSTFLSHTNAAELNSFSLTRFYVSGQINIDNLQIEMFLEMNNKVASSDGIEGNIIYLKQKKRV